MTENKKIGVRIVISQETNEHSYFLHEIFNVKEFNKDFPIAEFERLEKLKDNAIKLTKEF